jgi:excisionase family DNA binding protein
MEISMTAGYELLVSNTDEQLFENRIYHVTLLDKRQLAVRLNISVKMIDKLIARKAIPFIKIEKLVRFKWEDIEGWLKSRSHHVY